MSLVTNEPESFEVPLYCLYRGCEKRGRLVLHNPSSHGYGYEGLDGWIVYAPGFPTLRSLGFCPEHQCFAVIGGGGPVLDVVVRPEDHGVFYEISRSGTALGKTTVPGNTLVMQFAPGAVSDELRAAAPRVEAMLDFEKRNPARSPRLAARQELLSALTGRHQLTPIEVTAGNLDEVRRQFSLDDLGAGNIVWRIPNSNLFGVVYCRAGQAPPLWAIIGGLMPQQERKIYACEAFIVGHLADQDDVPLLQLGTNGGFVHLVTGQLIA
jgi:hypothetical protein